MSKMHLFFYLNSPIGLEFIEFKNTKWTSKTTEIEQEFILNGISLLGLMRSIQGSTHCVNLKDHIEHI